MVLSSLDWLAGISTIVMLVVGYTMGIKILSIWKKKEEHDHMILITSLLFFSLPSPWLEFAVRFILSLFDVVLDNVIGKYIFAWSVPTLVICWAFITSSLFKKQVWLKYLILAITAIPGLYFFYLVYFTDKWTYSPVVDSIGVNYIYDSVSEFLIYYYGLLGLAFIFPSHIYLSMKSTNKLVKFRTRVIAIAVFLFTIAAVLDALTQFDSIFNVLLLRVTLMSSLILMYLGYNTPNKIKNRFES